MDNTVKLFFNFVQLKLPIFLYFNIHSLLHRSHYYENVADGSCLITTYFRKLPLQYYAEFIY